MLIQFDTTTKFYMMVKLDDKKIFSQSIVFLAFSLSALTLLVDRQAGHPDCMKLDVDLLVVFDMTGALHVF